MKNIKSRKGIVGKILFYLSGFFATTWVLIRVIQKPSRINYPCIQTSIPVMVSFITYLSGITIVAVCIRFFRTYFRRKKYVLAGITAIAFIGGILLVNTSSFEKAFARTFKYNATYLPNSPFGEEKGFIPGRVVWVHDTAATDENTTNTEGDYWFMNTNQEAVDNMLDKGIKKLVEKPTLQQAWSAIFRYFNYNKGKGAIGYTSGEKIFIKLNFTNSCCCFPDRSTTEKNGRFDKMDSTPELVVSLLRHLVDSLGIEPENITVGDPFRRFPDSYYNVIHDAYPGVTYMDDAGINGRTQVTITSTPPLIFSDHQTGYEANIPQAYMDAAYFINLPCLKTHDAGGITLGAKNHQGSIMEKGKTTAEKQSAYFMHYCLPGDARGQELNSYRHLVDYMGHEKLGGNTLIYIVDAIWSGQNWEGNLTKWDMSPFNDDYPNSLFLSQDPVAIECVGFDFLYNEFGDDSNDGFPAMPGAIEYLEQAADPTKWPHGIYYDPEDDGTLLESLGVYEHWNNATDKKYSRNLGKDYGIELITVLDDLHIDISAVDTFLFPTTSINDRTFNIEMEVQMAKNGFYLVNNTDFENHQVTVLDIQGRVLFNKEIYSGRNSRSFMSLSFLQSNGIYIVKVQNPGGFISQKIAFRK